MTVGFLSIVAANGDIPDVGHLLSDLPNDTSALTLSFMLELAFGSLIVANRYNYGACF